MSTPVSRASRNALRGLGAEQQLRELAETVGLQASADSLRRDGAHARRFVTHLLQRLFRRFEAELRDEPKPAHEAQGILGETARSNRPQHAVREIGRSAERVDELTGLQSSRHRVDGEVAPLHVVFDREPGVGDDFEVVPARPGAPFGARRRKLDAGRRERPHPRVGGIQARTDASASDLEILDPAVWLERAA